jgi:lysozyme family protein
MPIVPIIDSPTVAPRAGEAQAFAAPGVEPMKNFQPEQGAKLGAATQAAGQTMIKVGEMLQDQIDDANTKAADSWYTSQAQKILFDPKNGYLNSLGLKAKDGYLPTQEALAKVRQDAEVALTTPVQKQMFKAVVAKHEINFASQMDNHAVRQIRVYAAGESEARQTQYTDLAIADPDPQRRLTYTETAVQEAKDRADLLQLPVDSVQRQSMIKGAYQAVHVGVADQLMLGNKFTEAKALVEKAFADGEMEGKTFAQLSKQIDLGYRKQQAVLKGDAIFKAGQAPESVDALSVIDYVIAKHEGGYVADDAGRGPTNLGINGKSNGLTPAQVKNLTLDKARQIYKKNYWDKIDADNLDPRIRAMAFDTAVNMGPDVAKKLLKDSDGNLEKFAELRKQKYINIVNGNKEKYGKFKDGWLNRVDDFVAAANGETQSLSSMIDRAKRTIPDQEDQDLTVARIKQQWSETESARTQDKQQRFSAAQQIAYEREGGWTNIPPKLWANLDQTERAQLVNRPKNSDSNTLLMLQENPNLWVKGSIEKYRPLLSESDYRAFVAKGGGEDGPSKVIAATIDQEQMKNQLLSAGLTDLISPKKDSSEMEERIRLNAQFEQRIDQAQRAKGNKQLSMDEKNAILVSMLKPVKVKAIGTTLPTWMVGNTMEKRAYQVESKTNIVVPDDMKQRIIKQFESRQMKYNNNDIIEAYLATQEK